MKKLENLATLLGALPAHDGVVMHSGAAHPSVLAGLLAASAEALHGRRVYTLMPQGPVAYAQAPARDALALSTFLPGASMRAAMDAGRVEPLRRPLSAIPAAIASGEFPVGAVLLRVSPPDTQGRVCLALSVDYMLQAVKSARLVVAEIDPTVPQAHGNCWINARRIDAFVDAVDGASVVAPVQGDEVDSMIAGHVASLIEDGAVLQLGVGSLPDQVLARLTHARHLGLHTGIFSDSAQRLIEQGVIDNSTKAVFRGVSVATMALGTADAYRFLDRNPAVEMHPCSVTHARDVLLQLGKLCAINSALQVDLDGRVNAEWVGERRVSLPGGLPDFARAASSMPQGRSIIALRATGRGGRSNIVANLDGKGLASLEAGEVDFYVSEFGVAAVRGASPAARRAALISIAAPDARDALQAA